MLEQAYWIAGIVAAVMAVIGLFLWRRKATININQTAKVSGQDNTVKQRLGSKSGEAHGD